MQPQKSMLLVMGFMILLFLMVGCSSNPMSSTETISVADNTVGGTDNTIIVPDDNGDTLGGYSTTVDTDIAKYDQDAEVESLPEPGD